VDLGSQDAGPRRDALPPGARLRNAARFALGSFGPLLTFWIGRYFGGTLLGIAGAVIWSTGDVLYRLAYGKPTSRLFWLTTVLTLGFGAFDLALGKSVFFRFEAVLTNLLTALYFGLSMATGKSVLEELYEKSQGSANSPTPELKAYLRLLTGVWAGYFLLKAGLYCWLALLLPLAKLMLVRSIVGNASLLALLGAERLQRMRLFRYLKAQGCLGTGSATSTTVG
jgi:uncharacterized membrane protein